MKTIPTSYFLYIILLPLLIDFLRIGQDKDRGLSFSEGFLWANLTRMVLDLFLGGKHPLVSIRTFELKNVRWGFGPFFQERKRPSPSYELLLELKYVHRNLGLFFEIETSSTLLLTFTWAQMRPLRSLTFSSGTETSFFFLQTFTWTKIRPLRSWTFF